MTLIQILHRNRIAFHTGKEGACCAEIGALVQVFPKWTTETRANLDVKTFLTLQILTLGQNKPATQAYRICRRAQYKHYLRIRT